jgi:hypothetical protein
VALDTIHECLKLVQLILRVDMLDRLEDHQEQRSGVTSAGIFALSGSLMMSSNLVTLDSRSTKRHEVTGERLANQTSQQTQRHVVRQVLLDHAITLVQ